MRLVRKKLKINRIRFASTSKIKRFHYEMNSLIVNLFGYDIDNIFISNESSLHDFLYTLEDVKTINNIVKKVKKIYNLDINTVKNKSIITIIKFMLKKDPSCFKKSGTNL